MNKRTKTQKMLPKLALRTIALLVAILSATSSFAYDFEVGGIYYEINGNEVSVTSSGKDNMRYAGDIVIPEQVSFNGNTYPVTSIKYYAFSGSAEMTSIIIPETVTSIGQGAFRDCSRLTEINLPSAITAINNYTFGNCSGLTECAIPSSVTTIEYYAFDGCSGLQSIYIPESVTNIDSNPFPNCANLGSIIVDANNPSYDSRDNCNAIIRTMDNTMLVGCMNTVIPNSVENIFDAFTGAANLRSITIPASVGSIMPGVFIGCTGLESIIVDNDNPYFDSRDNCNAIIFTETNEIMAACKNTSFPQSVTTIGMGAFQGNDALTNIVIPEHITSIGQYAFSNCMNLTTATIHGGCINGNAFSGCTNLSSVTIGTGVTEIMTSAFENCDNLLSLRVEENNPIFDSRNNCNAVIETSTNRLLLGCASTVIPNTVTAIAEHAFEFCTSITTISIPSSVSIIEDYAFFCSRSLKTVSFSNGVSYIGRWAFAGCWELEDFSLPNTLTTIGDYAFNGCKKLTQISIPKSITSIGYGIIRDCLNINSIEVAIENTVYDSRDNCNAIIETASNELIVGISITKLPSSLKSIGYEAFYGCDGITDLVIPGNIKSIKESAFSACHNLKRVILPNSTLTVFGNAFYGCTSLTELIIGDGVSFYGYNTFGYCNSLKYITCLSNTPPSIQNSQYNSYSKELFSNRTYNNATLYVPQNAIANYQAAEIWQKFANISAIETSNMIAVQDTSALHGKTIVIPITMNNIKELTAFQTDLYLPEGFELVKEDGDYLVELSDRKGRDHVIMANDLDDGGIRIISYSTTVKPYSGNEGELFYITVKTPDDGDGDYTIMLKNTLLTTTDHEELNAPDASCTVTVYPYIMGDANNSGTVTVTDIVVTARYILNYHPEPFVFGAADMNSDNNISVTDIVMIAQMIMDGVTTYHRHAPARGANLDRMTGAAMSIDGTRHSVSIALDNAADYTAFQLDLQLPAGMTAENFTLTDGSSSHTLDVNLLDNGKTRLLCYAPTLQALSGNEETLLTFDVIADGGFNRDIVVDDIEMVTADCQTVNLNAFTIKLDNLTSVGELKANVRIYSDGQDIVVESPVDVTVNVSNLLGRTTLVKAKAGRTVIPTDGNGIYIVNVGGAVAKLMLK